MHRISKANALLQTAQTAPPGLFDLKKVYTEWGAMMKISNMEALFMPPQQPQQDPAQAMIAAKLQLDQQKLAIDAQNAQTKQMEIAIKAQNADKDRQSKESIEAAKIAQQQHAAMMHAESANAIDPTQEAAMQLKSRQMDQQDARLMYDMHNSHAERQSKETIKAMDIASRLATHPESQPVVNAEMQGLSSFMEPAASNQPSMRDGGEVEAKPEAEEIDLNALLASITARLRGAESEYMN